MASLLLTLAAAAATLLTGVNAGFESASNKNIAVYWGQNSAGGSGTQQSLAFYCANSAINIIPLAFMDLISGQDINFASASDDCTAFPGSRLLNCPQIAADIKTCQQQYSKTIMLSVGGATYTEGGFTSVDAAQSAARNIWAMFGPTGGNINRPFGDAVVDGFDFDFESATQNMTPFGQELRSLMDDASDKQYYLSAAPQCVFPDAADNGMLNGAVAFDFINIQFYNNYCGVNAYNPGASTQNNFNFATWDNWARTVSANKNVKLLLGIPASATAAGTGYVTGSQLSAVIANAMTYSSFGGVMMWDMSQLWNNAGYLDLITSALAFTSPPAATPTPSKPQPTTMTTITIPAPTTGIAQWGQCGGTGYTGPSQCAAPYSCVCGASGWWCQCQ